MIVVVLIWDIFEDEFMMFILLVGLFIVDKVLDLEVDIFFVFVFVLDLFKGNVFFSDLMG